MRIDPSPFREFSFYCRGCNSRLVVESESDIVDLKVMPDEVGRCVVCPKCQFKNYLGDITREYHTECVLTDYDRFKLMMSRPGLSNRAKVTENRSSETWRIGGFIQVEVSCDPPQPRSGDQGGWMCFEFDNRTGRLVQIWG